MREWRPLERGDPIEVVLRFETGFQRTIASGRFGGLVTVDAPTVCFEIHYDDGTSELFGLGDVVEMKRRTNEG